MEFVGELYRMSLSCSGGESGCLFFKVGGETNLTKGKPFFLHIRYYHSPDSVHTMTNMHAAKFDDRVPGTIQTLENHITTTTVTTVSSAIQPTSDHEVLSASHPKSSISSTILTTHSPASPLSATTDLTIYIIVAAAGGVAALLFVVILLCMILVYCAMTSRTNTATSNNNKDMKDLGLAP